MAARHADLSDSNVSLALVPLLHLLFKHALSSLLWYACFCVPARACVFASALVDGSVFLVLWLTRHWRVGIESELEARAYRS